MSSKKVDVFRDYFDEELGKHKSMNATFRAAKDKFEKEKGLNSYSCYESFLNSIRNKK